MSFRNELNASIKTPQQVAKEKEDSDIVYAKLCAQNDSQILKKN